MISDSDIIIESSEVADDFIDKMCRKYRVSRTQQIVLTDEEMAELLKKRRQNPSIATYSPGPLVIQSGSLYERYEKSRFKGSIGDQFSSPEDEIDNLFLKKKRKTLPASLYRLKKGSIGPDRNTDEEEDQSNPDDQINWGAEESDDDQNQFDENHEEESINEVYQEEEMINDVDQEEDQTDLNCIVSAPIALKSDSQSEDEENDLGGHIGATKERHIDIEINSDGLLLEEEEANDGFIDHDVHLDLEYPPGFGPNSLGIDAFDLQQRALREYNNSTDDDDDTESNCGCGHNGAAEVILQISLEYFLPSINQVYNGSFTIDTVPRAEWETIKAKGFDWILFEDLPSDTDFKKLCNTLHSCRLRVMIDYSNDETAQYFDGLRIHDNDAATYHQKFSGKTIISVCGYKENPQAENELKSATYIYDNRPIQCLKNRDMTGFIKAIRDETNEDDRKHLLHYMCTNGLFFNDRSTRTAAAMLLTLPGMRLIDYREIELVDLALIVLCKKAVRKGTFQFVNYTTNGNAFVWKYKRDQQHILVVANFDTKQTTTRIVIDDCPTTENKKVPFVDILTQTTYLRDPKEMSTKGLAAILYEYEIQIFEY